MSDLFAQDPGTAGQATPTNDGAGDLLASIVNEEGVQKYATVEEALKGLQHSQEFIGKLKQENESFRQELDKRLSIEQALHELKAGTKTDEQPSTGLDPEAIQELVDKRLEARTQEEKAKANENYVQAKLRAALGEEAMRIVQGTAKDLGMSPEQLRNLSQEAPDAVLKMFGVASQAQAAPSKIHSSTAVETQGTEVRNWAYWTKMRKENPSLYRSKYTQMMRDREALGDKFY